MRQNSEGLSLELPSQEEAMKMLSDEFDDWSTDGQKTADVQLESDIQEIPVENQQNEDLFAMLAQVPDERVLESNEISQYFTEPKALGNGKAKPTDPLLFWKINSSRWPTLSGMARKFLAIPASSAGVERIFSLAGWFSRARRASISVDNVARLLWVRDYLMFLNGRMP